MLQLYPRWIDAWERRLSQRDTNRTVRAFEWGLEWLDGAEVGKDPSRYVREYAWRSAGCSEEFFSYQRPVDYATQGSHLTFTSPLVSFHAENNLVHADFFPAVRDQGRAVVVLPQWNADSSGHVALCRMLNRFGISALACII